MPSMRLKIRMQTDEALDYDNHVSNLRKKMDIYDRVRNNAERVSEKMKGLSDVCAQEIGFLVGELVWFPNLKQRRCFSPKLQWSTALATLLTTKDVFNIGIARFVVYGTRL